MKPISCQKAISIVSAKIVLELQHFLCTKRGLFLQKMVWGPIYQLKFQSGDWYSLENVGLIFVVALGNELL